MTTRALVGAFILRCEEYLLLTELCVASMYDYLSARDRPYPPITVARIFFQVDECHTHYSLTTLAYVIKLFVSLRLWRR